MDAARQGIPKRLSAAAVAVALCTAGAAEPGGGAVTVTHRAMATEFAITVYARPENGSTAPVERIAEKAFEAVDDLERRISSWLPESQTTRLNRRGHEGPVRVSHDLFELITFAKRVYEDTDGAFDITVGPLLEAWGLRKGRGAGDPAEALAYVGMDKVRLDPASQTVAFDREGIRLDLGGIGKGLALDQAARVLKEHGVETALLHAGTSTVLAMGAPPGEAGWTVHIRHPIREGDTIDSVVLRDESLSTSGCYGPAPDVEGGPPCDVVDPRTGEPVKGILSATALGKTAMETDALSTAFLVMGPHGTRRYCRQAHGVRAILVPVPLEGEPAAQRIGFANEDRNDE